MVIFSLPPLRVRKRDNYRYRDSWKSNNLSHQRAITLERELSIKSQERIKKKDAKRIKSDNFTRGNREKSNIAIAILEILMIEWLAT